MAKFKVTVGSAVQKKIRDQIEAVLQEDALLLEVGTIARNDIVANIVKAQEPATGAKFQKPTITPEWKERKKRLSTVNTPFDAASGGGTKAARLIFTGQWIKSIVNGIAKVDGRKVIDIGPSGFHTPYRGIKGKLLGENMTNQELGQYLKEGGRDWTGFPEKTRARLVTAVRNYIRRKLTTRNK